MKHEMLGDVSNGWAESHSRPDPGQHCRWMVVVFTRLLSCLFVALIAFTCDADKHLHSMVTGGCVKNQCLLLLDGNIKYPPLEVTPLRT